VSDTGSGFDPATVKKAGEDGRGFGLFSIRERLDMMGGRMEIQSVAGSGSRIMLTLPLSALGETRGEASAPPATEPDAAARAPSAPKPGGRISVLLVDDHAVVREGLAQLLSHEPDIQIVGQAVDGRGAVEMARGLRPHVILMDANMPELNGVEATGLIHGEFPEIVIIGLSMFQEEEHAHAMRDAGAADYLTKSGSPDSLIAAIRRCAGQSEKNTG